MPADRNITPTRRLSAKERRVFDRIINEYAHLTAADGELITQYAEATILYETAAKDAKKRPVIEQPIINKRSGNIVGSRQQRNPALVTMRQQQTLMATLSRRLMIDPASTEKRLRLESKQRRIEAALPQPQEPTEAAAPTEREINSWERWLRQHDVTLNDRVTPRQTAEWMAFWGLDDDADAHDFLRTNGFLKT